MRKQSGSAATGTGKLHPKVRMVRNGGTLVNVARAEISGSVRIDDEELISKHPPAIETDLATRSRSETPTRPGVVADDKTPRATMSVFVQLTETSQPDSGDRDHEPLDGEVARVGDLVTVDIPIGHLEGLIADPNIAFIETGEPVELPRPQVTHTTDQPTTPSFLRIQEKQHRRGAPRDTEGTGKNVLIGIIDVGGFDFAHIDFLADNGATRFVRIWDQGGTVRPPPDRFGYGSEFTADHLNRALADADTVGLPATRLEPQSQMQLRSHGTHVASIAAGNRGVCSNADIAAVLLELSDEDHDRRRSFYDSTRIAHAVKYLTDYAEAQGQQISINISLGTNGHAHDASSPTSRWLDSLLVKPGRAISVAAGNAGQTEPRTPDDPNFILGRIHSNGRIAAAGLRHELEWIVVGNGIEDISENELEIWYPPQDRFRVQVKPPGKPWTRVVEPRQFLQNLQLDDGTFLSIYNELYHPANGANHISIYLSPFLSPDTVKGVRPGTWKVRLEGLEVRDGRYHCWIERDDPRPIAPVGDGEAWVFPSYFAPSSFVAGSTVSSLACGHRIISVANHDEAAESINVTSSRGPTRDARAKPDIAGPGTSIVAANGFSAGREHPWVAMTGTSMASPHVAGVAGLMLAIEPNLTAAQMVGIIRRTAQPLPGAGFDWHDQAGFGLLDPAKCLREAATFSTYTDLAGRSRDADAGEPT